MVFRAHKVQSSFTFGFFLVFGQFLVSLCLRDQKQRAHKSADTQSVNNVTPTCAIYRQDFSKGGPFWYFLSLTWNNLGAAVMSGENP